MKEKNSPGLEGSFIFIHILRPYRQYAGIPPSRRYCALVRRFRFCFRAKKPRPPREERDIKQLDFLFQHRHKRFRATTANRPFSVEYSHVDSTISLSPYRAVTPVS